jgi:hypothetical protein
MSSNSLQTTAVTAGFNDETPSQPAFTAVVNVKSAEGCADLKAVPTMALKCASCKKEQCVRFVITHDDRMDDLVCLGCRRETWDNIVKSVL